MKLKSACFVLVAMLAASIADAQVTGSGTKYVVPVWSGTKTLGDSAIVSVGGSVGIGTGTSAPGAKLDVESASATQSVILANNSSTTTTGSAVLGIVSSPSAAAVAGLSNAGTGAGLGGFFQSSGSGSVATGVIGQTTSTTGFGNGVVGTSYGTTGSGGVVGTALSTTSDSVFGVVGFAVSGSGGTGVLASGQGIGILASTRSCEGSGCPTPGTAGFFITGNGGTVLLGQTDSGAGGVNVFRVDDTGKGFFDGGTQTGGADFAESVAVAKNLSPYAPGDLLIVDTNGKRQLRLSAEPYSTLVAGIYSTKPGVLATSHKMDQVASNEIPLAIVGIVPCKVSAENGPIHPGDLLVTSSTPGHAMKGTDRNRMLGAVVGKALEPLVEGIGTIQVLVTLQ